MKWILIFCALAFASDSSFMDTDSTLIKIVDARGDSFDVVYFQPGEALMSCNEGSCWVHNDDKDLKPDSLVEYHNGQKVKKYEKNKIKTKKKYKAEKGMLGKIKDKEEKMMEP